MSLLKRQSQCLSPFRGLNDLPIELVERILDLVDWPYGFGSLTLVSKALNGHATPHLYAILPIAWAHPERTCALLAFLQRDVHRANMVRTIVWDKDLDCLGYISDVDLSFVNLPLADVHLERLARLLCEELPLLRSVRHVVIRMIHPKLLHTSVQVVRYPPRRRRISWTRLAFFWRKYSRSYYSCFNSPAGNFWDAMNLSVQRIESLEAPLHSYSKPSPWTLRQLTFLSLLGRWGYSFPQSDTWHRTLAEASKLQTLEFHTCRGEDLAKFGLFKLRLPFLATLICHGPVFEEVKQCDDFSAFLLRHANSLEILSFYHLLPLPEVYFLRSALRCLSSSAASFRRLRVLRIFNLPDHSCPRCAVNPAVHRQRCGPPDHDLLVERIATFIQQCPTITDVAFTGLDNDSRAAFCSYVNTTSDS